MFPLLTKKYALSIFRKIRLLSVTAAAAAIFVLCLFFSCSEDVIIVNQLDFDPPRFNWRSMDIYNHGFAGMWALDTSRIYLLNHDSKSLYIISSGNVVTLNIGNYFLNEIKGISTNEVYIFGTLVGGNMTIIKWNGAGFEFYPSSIYVSGFGVNYVRGCVVNSNEIWICSQSGISRFDGTQMVNYSYEDSLLIPTDFFYSNDTKRQYIAERWKSDLTIQVSIFEFRDSGFVRIYDNISQPNPMSFTFPREVGGFKFGFRKYYYNICCSELCFDYYADSIFTPYFCLSKKITDTHAALSSTAGINGFRLQNFMVLVSSPLNKPVFDPFNVGIVHWDGSTVSREIGLRPYISPYDYDAFIIKNINSDSYLLLAPYSDIYGNNTLFIGTKK